MTETVESDMMLLVVHASKDGKILGNIDKLTIKRDEDDQHNVYYQCDSSTKYSLTCMARTSK